jgi:AcrR family transcriptional regulator
MSPSGISRRDALLAAALECVAEKGFEGMRLRDVAGREGIDHSTLHHHFATKETLVEALVAEVVGRFRPTMPAAGVPRQRCTTTWPDWPR